MKLAPTVAALMISLTASGCTLGTAAESELDGDGASEQGPGGSSGAFAATDGPLTVLMIVDRSGSMAQDWEGTPKWQIARDAVSHAIVGVEDQLTAAALLFPIPESCTVEPLNHPSQIDFQQGGDFLEAWQANGQVSSPGGSTPLGEAFRQADAAIEQARQEGRLEGRFRVVLVSDGAPSCYSSEQEVVDRANSWREAGIDVRVMGLPGSSEAAALLNRIAGEEVYEDPDTGEVVVPDSDASWTEDPNGSTGYIEPESSGDVDDSFYHAVR